jgi:hypothetical protein
MSAKKSQDHDAQHLSHPRLKRPDGFRSLTDPILAFDWLDVFGLVDLASYVAEHFIKDGRILEPGEKTREREDYSGTEKIIEKTIELAHAISGPGKTHQAEEILELLLLAVDGAEVPKFCEVQNALNSLRRDLGILFDRISANGQDAMKATLWEALECKPGVPIQGLEAREIDPSRGTVICTYESPEEEQEAKPTERPGVMAGPEWPKDTIPVREVLDRWIVSRATLRRYRGKGDLHAYRGDNAARTVGFKYSEAELVDCFGPPQVPRSG